MAGPGQRVDEYMRDYRYPDPYERDSYPRSRRETWRQNARPSEPRSFDDRALARGLASQFDPRPDHEPDRYTPNPREGRGNGGRDAWDKTRDEVASWFGDEDAHRRREWDAMHAGKGPKNYKRSDARIHEDVNDRLMEDPYVDASDIEVDVKDGEVTLNGTVFDRGAKRHAEDVVERVSGVGHVQNNLRARPAGELSGYDAGAATGGRTTGMVRNIADGER